MKNQLFFLNFFLLSSVILFSANLTAFGMNFGTEEYSGWTQKPLLLSLRQAEELAIQNNYQLNASLHRLEQGYYGYRASKDYFLPKVNFSSEADVGKDQRGIDSLLQLTQPLYDKAAIYYLKGAQIEWERLRLEVQQQMCDILFQVRDAYYAVLLNQAHLAVDQMVIQLWEEEIKRQERHLELGASIPFELNQTKMHLKSAWIDYYATQSSIKSSRSELLTLLGLASDTPFCLIEQDIPLPPFNWQKCGIDQWMKWAFQYRPQLKQEQFSYLLSQNKMCQTKAENFPTLSLFANAGHHYVNNGFDHQPYIGAGMNLNWTLYDPSNRQRIKQAREEIREAVSNYYQIELETKALVYNLLNEVEQSYLAYLAAQEGGILAEEGMRMATKKHQLGMMSSFEFRDVIKSLHEAQQTINQAKFDVRNAYDRLIQATGLDLWPTEERKWYK
jgi:outer membrane protein